MAELLVRFMRHFRERSTSESAIQRGRFGVFDIRETIGFEFDKMD